MMKQLSFFPESAEEKFEKKIAHLEQQCEKVRKGQFAKIGELLRLYNETRNEIETLKAAICRTVIK